MTCLVIIWNLQYILTQNIVFYGDYVAVCKELVQMSADDATSQAQYRYTRLVGNV